MSKLICVTSRTLCYSPFLPRLETIARAGAGAILLREKDLPLEEYATLAHQVLSLCRQAGIPCILHGHPEAALALGADALHLPMPALRSLDGTVRARFARLGASCHSLEEARELRPWAAPTSPWATSSPPAVSRVSRPGAWSYSNRSAGQSISRCMPSEGSLRSVSPPCFRPGPQGPVS